MVTPRLCSCLMNVISSSQALTSIKLTELMSKSTCFIGGRISASEFFKAASIWPALAKNKSPPTRQINKLGKGTGLRVAPNVAVGLGTWKLAEHRSLQVAGYIDQFKQA